VFGLKADSIVSRRQHVDNTDYPYSRQALQCGRVAVTLAYRR